MHCKRGMMYIVYKIENNTVPCFIEHMPVSHLYYVSLCINSLCDTIFIT